MSADASGGPHDERRGLIEQVTSAWRPRDRDGRIMGHPAWYDLGEDGRVAVYRTTAVIRRIEAALDPEGLSSTGRTVMARIVNG
jgi:hypothetical protein